MTNQELIIPDISSWKQIPEHEHYVMSIEGDLFSLRSNRILKRVINSHGYYYISTKVNGKRKNYLTHRIIMMLYGPPKPEGKNFINHIDGNKKNNNLSNLEWCNHSENMHHSVNVLKNPKPPSHLGRVGALSKLSKPIIATNLTTGEKLFFESIRRADAIGYRISGVRNSMVGKTNKYKGFKWELA